MGIAENKELVRKFYDAVEREDYDEVATYCHEDFTFYTQVDTPIPGAGGFIESEKRNFDAFNGFKMPIQDLIAEDDRVAAYLIFEGTLGSELYGLPVKGQKLRFSLFMKLRIADGKIIEKRAHFDVNDIINQLKSQL
jgi:steroid delta-isomerase-like uncharacterized protein